MGYGVLATEWMHNEYNMKMDRKNLKIFLSSLEK